MCEGALGDSFNYTCEVSAAPLTHFLAPDAQCPLPIAEASRIASTHARAAVAVAVGKPIVSLEFERLNHVAREVHQDEQCIMGNRLILSIFVSVHRLYFLSSQIVHSVTPKVTGLVKIRFWCNAALRKESNAVSQRCSHRSRSAVTKLA